MKFREYIEEAKAKDLKVGDIVIDAMMGTNEEMKILEIKEVKSTRKNRLTTQMKIVKVQSKDVFYYYSDNTRPLKLEKGLIGNIINLIKK